MSALEGNKNGEPTSRLCSAAGGEIKANTSLHSRILFARATLVLESMAYDISPHLTQSHSSRKLSGCLSYLLTMSLKQNRKKMNRLSTRPGQARLSDVSLSGFRLLCTRHGCVNWRDEVGLPVGGRVCLTFRTWSPSLSSLLSSSPGRTLH